MFRPELLWVTALSVLATACGGATPPPSDDNGGFNDNGITLPLPDPMEASTIEDDAGVLDIGNRPSHGSNDTGEAGPSDSGPATACAGPVASGDVKIVELMIESIAGTGDRGEWIELRNTASCIVNLNGLVVRSPRGTATDQASVTSDVLVAPGGSFLIVDSASPTDNHNLPTAAIAASFNSYDVLKNSGDTVEVYVGTTLIDAVTYPQLTLTVGRSVSFPSDCAWSDRASWSRWSGSFHVWSSPFQGTPGADNTDVTCY